MTDHALLVEALLPEASPQDRAWVLERHRSYPPAALVEPGRLSRFLELGLPTGYVVATEDLMVPPSLAHTFARRLPGVGVAEVAAGHDLMLTRPRGVRQPRWSECPASVGRSVPDVHAGEGENSVEVLPDRPIRCTGCQCGLSQCAQRAGLGAQFPLSCIGAVGPPTPAVQPVVDRSARLWS